jgi:uncharacterized protein YjiS (DUF1127 family)
MKAVTERISRVGFVRKIKSCCGPWKGSSGDGARRRRRAAIRELRALDHRTLKDMGLTRGEIIAAVDGCVHGREPDRHDPKLRRGTDAARDPAALRAHDDRVRQLRAESIAGLLRRGCGRLVRLLRRAALHGAHARQEPACPLPASRGLRPGGPLPRSS